MRVEAPTSAADRAPLLTTALVFFACLAIGLGIARWTVGTRPPSAHGPSTLEDEGSAPASEESAGSASAGSASAGSASVVPSEPSLVPEIAPAEVAGEVADVDVPAPEIAASPVAAPPVAVAPEPVAPEAVAPVIAGPARSRLSRGRVAYLRCEGGGSGGTCSRDHAIEDAIWSAIETLPTCGSGPPPPGQADLVVELGGESGVEVRARDTFAADVVRLDGASTVACLSSGLLADPALTTSSRRVVLSFRFSLDTL